MWEFVCQASWARKREGELLALCPSMVPLDAWHKRLLADDPCWEKPRIRVAKDLGKYKADDPISVQFGLPIVYVERRSGA